MFESLTQSLNSIFDKIKSRGRLSEKDVADSLREIRISLLESDVSLSVVKEFIDSVRKDAIGKKVFSSISPGNMVVKIVNDNLIKILGKHSSELLLDVKPPAVIMMVGLQGSGKTTSTVKLALHLKNKNKKVLLCSLDIYRPAAQEQLSILADKHGIRAISILENEPPLDIAIRSQKIASLEGYDILILDTAGRMHIDGHLMNELKSIDSNIDITETLLVADALTGQDAVNIAYNFNKELNLTGVVLTRVDGDSKGGSALSMSSVTGCPIKFIGVGESIYDLDVFHPDRTANLILGKSDIVSLVEKSSEVLDQEASMKEFDNLKKGLFDFNDFLSHLNSISKMGDMSSLSKMMSGINSKFNYQSIQSAVSDKTVTVSKSIILSMTTYERKNPDILNGSRKRRISRGSGVNISDVNRLLKQFKDTRTLMKKMNKSGTKGLKNYNLFNLFNRK
jgi:signal recognition particle subunit SRP54